MKILFFTATGNSLAVAKSFGCDCLSIPKLLKNKEYYISDEEAVGFVFPTYGHNVPEIVLEFIYKAKITSPYNFVIMTSAHGSAGAAGYFATIAKKRGIPVSYANDIAMVSNHIPMADIEAEMREDKGFEAKLEQLKKDVEERKLYIMPAGASLGRNVIKFVHKIHPDGCSNFMVADACVGCGICAKVCPRDNISIINAKPVFGEKCEGCRACVHACPKKAILVKGDKNPDIRYRNERVTLAEIMEANH